MHLHPSEGTSYRSRLSPVSVSTPRGTPYILTEGKIMKNNKRVYFLVVAVVASILLSSCTLPPVRVNEYVVKPYGGDQFVQKKHGVEVEMLGAPQIVTDGNKIPAIFEQTAIRCNANGVPMTGTSGAANSFGSLFQTSAPTETVRLLQPGMWLQKISITNNTRHILRFNDVAVRLFDPSGNQADPIGHNEMRADLLSARPCPTSNQVAASIARIPLLNKNVEIVPHTSFTGYLIFSPQNPISGVWKVALYEVPVATDRAGRVTRTTQFVIRSVLKHYVATYKRAFGKPPVLVSRQEVK